MSGLDLECRRLAEQVLRDYRLTGEERAQETERLAQQVQQMVEDELEALAHRKKA